jgi:hypothetical protein
MGIPRLARPRAPAKLARCPTPDVSPFAPCPGNAGIVPRYPIDLATWIWLPGRPADARQFAEFRLAFNLEQPTRLEFEVSADQRFVLRLDGAEIGRGPDRAELAGWSAHRYAVEAAAGDHALEATVWWLPANERPFAQASARPAFAVRGIGEHEALLSTRRRGRRASRAAGVCFQNQSGSSIM